MNHFCTTCYCSKNRNADAFLMFRYSYNWFVVSRDDSCWGALQGCSGSFQSSHHRIQRRAWSNQERMYPCMKRFLCVILFHFFMGYAYVASPWLSWQDYPSFFYPKLGSIAKEFLPKFETVYYIHNFKGRSGGVLFRWDLSPVISVYEEAHLRSAQITRVCMNSSLLCTHLFWN